MKNMTYQEKMDRTNKEAKATFFLSLIIFAFFALSILITKDLNIFVMGMPLWFVLSCLVGYLLSVVGVIVLVKYFMQNFSLDDESSTNKDTKVTTNTTNEELSHE